MITTQGPWGQVGIGNYFFIYTYLRLLSEELNLEFKTNPITFSERNGIHEQQQYKFLDLQGNNYSNEEVIYIDDSFSNHYGTIENAVEYLKNKKNHIVSRGYYQKYSYWEKHKKKVKGFFSDFVGKEKYNNDFVCIHLRNSLEDNRFKLPEDYYLNSLEDLGIKRVRIFADNFQRHSGLIDKIKSFKKNETQIVDLNVQNSIREMTKYKNIICSQGSFSFWVAFLSSAKKVYWPIPKIGPNNSFLNPTIDYTCNEKKYNLIYLKDYD